MLNQTLCWVVLVAAWINGVQCRFGLDEHALTSYFDVKTMALGFTPIWYHIQEVIEFCNMQASPVAAYHTSG